MKIEEAINILVISYKGRKYKRVAHLNPDGTERIEWKNNRTNHTLSKDKSKELEDQYSLITGSFVDNSIVRNGLLRMSTKKIKKVVKEITPMLEKGMTLAAVKYVKEETGWGLKEAKDYVDSFREKLKKSGVI